jgi:hypothetical protein
LMPSGVKSESTALYFSQDLAVTLFNAFQLLVFLL